MNCRPSNNRSLHSYGLQNLIKWYHFQLINFVLELSSDISLLSNIFFETQSSSELVKLKRSRWQFFCKSSTNEISIPSDRHLTTTNVLCEGKIIQWIIFILLYTSSTPVSEMLWRSRFSCKAKVEVCSLQLHIWTLNRMHRGLGRRFCDRYEVTHALIQKLTSLLSNSSM